MTPVFAIMVLCAFLVLASLGLLLVTQRQEVTRRRIEAITGRQAARIAAEKERAGLVTRGLVGLGNLALSARLFSAATIDATSRMLAGASIRGETAVAQFFGAKIMLLALLPVVAWTIASTLDLSSNQHTFAAIGGAITGLLAPDAMVRNRRNKRVVALERGLPDALDLLVICTEAGLALEAALERVTRDISTVWADVAEEFSVTSAELRITSDRRGALVALGTRLDIDCFRRLSVTLVQSMQLGTPLSRALRGLAAEMRQEQLIRYEAKAAKLPVMLTVPMIVFIMPTVFLVVAGPAAIQVMRQM
jgi:tight adherence protein C